MFAETPGDWSCLVEQAGMFGYTGLNTAQVRYLAGKLPPLSEKIRSELNLAIRRVPCVYGGYWEDIHRSFE